MSSFTLRQLEYFAAVARNGSIASAAASLKVSRSAVAAGLDDLEAIIGVPLLLRRRSSGVELTNEGREFLEGANELIAHADDLSSRLTHKAMKGHLHIGCFSSIAPTVLPLIMSHFRHEYPEVQLSITTDSQETLKRMLAVGEIDLAILYRFDAWEHFEWQDLYEVRMHAIVAGSHPFASQPVVTAEQFAREPFILVDTPPSPQHANEYFGQHRLTPRIVRRIAPFELVRALVARDEGVSIAVQVPPASLSYEGLDVVARPLVPWPSPVPVAVAWARDRALTSRARRFVTVTQHYAERIAPRDVYQDAPATWSGDA